MAETLPVEMLESQLDKIELLCAMYSSEELAVEDEIDDTLRQYRSWCEDPRNPVPAIPEEITLRLTLPVGEDDEKQISMDILVRLKNSSGKSELPTSRVRPVQPSWLTRAETSQLSSTNIPTDDILSAIEHVREQAKLRLSVLSRRTPPVFDSVSQPLVRVWFYFPSISTRAKRSDLVNLAPTYSLTGFLLAGKPGILCLEGGAQDVDDYMRYIKTESWGDIPSQHKKVSERHREVKDVKRQFEGMEEITGEMEMRGQRGNRGDMRALEAWLVERGLERRLGRVLM